MTKELHFGKLSVDFDPTSIMSCETTEDLSPLEGIIGQERAVKSIMFGLNIKENGFNIYVAGQQGTGRMTAVKDFLEEIAKTKTVPLDWCYVNNFKNPYEPRAIQLKAGKGKAFQKDVQTLISEVRRALPETFQSEEYAAKRETTLKIAGETQKRLLEQINNRAREEGFILRSTPVGVLLIPLVNGKPLSDEDFMQLSQQKQEEIRRKQEELNSEFRSAVRQLKSQEGKIKEELEKLNRDVALYTIGYLVDALKKKYREFSEIILYLEEVKEDILNNIQQFISKPTPPNVPFRVPWMEEAPFRKYQVNLLVDNSELTGAPVVMELNPTYSNLFGRTEKEAQFGALTTDFTMIRAGSLHKANGGYIVIYVSDILQNLLSWDSLKRALKNERITIEEAGERLGFITTKGLKPEPVPLETKVVLIGDPMLYQTLYIYDKDFKELFKVKAEFDSTMERNKENIKKYASFICTFCREKKLNHLNISAVAEIIKYGSRLASDQKKLSTRFADIADVIREACFYAKQDNSDYVNAKHVKKAIEEKIYRSSLIQEKLQEMIERDLILINTTDQSVGQVNGLSVIGLGDFAFGRPSRVTASIGLGREGVIDIEREAKLGGPIHTKGVMILSGYLTQKYAQDKPFSLSARLVFEQSYSGVEGDSASSTELYAILSALSEQPIKQSIAVTGSVNQKGEIQAIGGVNEKIEGFFEVCKAKGLTGQQGVMIPKSNEQNLMLKEELLKAVKEGKFHIYSVKTIDEGIEILTGNKAGTRKKDGFFEEGTINYKVNKRLHEFTEKMKEYPGITPKKRQK